MAQPLPTFSAARSEWFAAEMAKNRASYTQPKHLSLFTGTWNVNGGAIDPSLDIKPWLFPVHDTRNQPFDLYMIALEEIQSLSGVDAFRSDLSKGAQWCNLISQTLGSDYEQIAERQLVGILVLVFLRKNHTPFLSDVQLSYAATGFLNAVGNKGGVAARFKLYDRTIACVACHLAAHTSYVERRNQDFTDVVRKAVFLPPDSEHLSENSPSSSAGSRSAIVPSRQSAGSADSFPFTNASNLPAVAVGTGAWLGSMASVAAAAFSDMSAGANTAILNDPNSVKILDHDVVFWLGDLNYRIDAPLQDVLMWIKESNWGSLYRADQLQEQMRTCEIFTGFNEGPIRFPPTYKLERYGEEYSVDENGEIKRVPAYTDRILWRIGKDPKDGNDRDRASVKLQHYMSAKVYSSDHRPVYALFTMTFGVEGLQSKMNVEAEVIKKIDKREASMRPAIKLSASLMDYGDVFFEKACHRTLTITNSGGSEGIFSVVLPPSAPKWLVFETSRYTQVKLPPGKSVAVNFQVYITGKDAVANDVASRGCILEMTIGVAADPGRLRQRIQLRGRYVPTTLGLSLETLAMLATPVFSLRGSEPMDKLRTKIPSIRESEQEQLREPGVVPFSVPKELWLLVNALLRVHDGDDEPYMWRFPKLFIRSGDEVAVERVLSYVDRGERIPRNLSGYAVASCLLKVLTHLEDSVIPRVMYRTALEAGYAEDPEVVLSIISMLPPLNANVFWYIIGLLWETPMLKGKSMGADKELAAVFGKVLLSTKEFRRPRDERYEAAFILTALRVYKKSKEPVHRIVFDLSHPATHPKKIDESIAR